MAQSRTTLARVPAHRSSDVVFSARVALATGERVNTRVIDLQDDHLIVAVSVARSGERSKTVLVSEIATSLVPSALNVVSVTHADQPWIAGVRIAADRASHDEYVSGYHGEARFQASGVAVTLASCELPGSYGRQKIGFTVRVDSKIVFQGCDLETHDGISLASAVAVLSFATHAIERFQYGTRTSFAHVSVSEANISEALASHASELESAHLELSDRLERLTGEEY